jgi:protein-tyrosine phosphatase
MAGVSRSPTIVASYLIRKYGESTEKVIKHLQRKRGKVDIGICRLIQIKVLLIN